MTRQIPLALPHRQAMGASDFYLSASNRDAVALLDRWPDWPSYGLVLWGPPGSGKTHLAHVWQQRSNALFVRHVTPFPQHASNLILDEAALLPPAKETEEDFLHFLNRCKEEGKSLLMLANEAPARWSIRLADLSSRLAALPSIAIHQPDDDLLAVVLAKHFSDRQLPVQREILSYLLKRIDRSFAAAAAIVDQIDRFQLAVKRPLSLPLIREMLRENESARS